MFHSFMSLLFPSRCVGCGRKEETICFRCLVNCRKTLDTPHPFIFSFFDFKEKLIRQAIHSIKYYHRQDLVEPLTRAAKGEIAKIPNIDNYILVPIPMPPLRKLLRGYNQAELIATAFGRELSLPVRSDILTRNRSPLRQVKTRTRTERVQNQKGSFVVEKNVSGMHIMLIDDVTTTGATLEEARGALLSKKAANVLAMTISH